MKKSLILGLLGLAATAATTFGQGAIILDNYSTGGPDVRYGTSGLGGTINTGISSSFTMGLYWVLGSPAIGADPNPNPIGDPSTFTGGLVLGTGTGSTAQFVSTSFGTAGEAQSGSAFNVPGTPVGGGTTVTLMIVAYNGANYASSTIRGHSASFTIVTSASSSPAPVATGTVSPAFSVFSAAVPEPSVLALSGIGAAALMLFRRKK